ncbi:hypothetical protein JW859_04580 [bacterium]|nr:hypothetical protein [bacterium]
MALLVCACAQPEYQSAVPIDGQRNADQPPRLGSPREVSQAVIAPIKQVYEGGQLLLGANAVQYGTCYNVADEDYGLRFHPTGVPAGQTPVPLAYAVFTFDLEDFDGPEVISLEWEEPAPAEGDYFLGLGNFFWDHWDWYTGSAIAGHQYTPKIFNKYVSTHDVMVVAVIVAADSEPRLNAVTVGERWMIGGADLSLLYAPPVPAEMHGVEEIWAQRNPVAADFVIEAEATDGDGFRTLVVSHTVDDLTHYGAVRVPPGGSPGAFPVLMQNHAGGSGTGVGEFSFIDTLVENEEIRNNFILVAPSFRGEALSGNDLGSFMSEGTQSLYNRDADDAIALLDCVLSNFPEADASRVIMMGVSRGAQVAQRVAERDDRVTGVIEFFGQTDYWLPIEQTYFAADVTAAANGETASGLAYGLLNGDFSVWDLRLSMVLWSTVYFAEDLPRIQIHHGEEDPAVPFEQGARLAAVLETLPDADYQFYRYPNGSHSTFSLDGCGERVRDFLLSFLVLE